MKNYFAANKFKLAYTFLILAFIIAACNYPVTQQETAGDVLRWNVSNSNTEANKKIENLDWIKNGQCTIDDKGVNGKTIVVYQLVVPKEEHGKINDYKALLQSIDGVNSLSVIPLNETVKRPVYSAVLNGLFKIDINATGMSNEELSGQISSELKKAGIENAEVTFENFGQGERRIRLFVPEQQGGFDMTIKDGNNINRIKEFMGEHPDGEGSQRFKNKSDAEIRNMVREDVGDPSLTDNQIEIKRDGDKIMISVKKQGTNESKHMELKVK